MLRDILIQKGLSSREAEVAELVTRGLSNKEVANQLFVTEKTVKFHLTNIYKKMNVKSRAQLIVWCLPHLNFVESENTMGTGTNTLAAGHSATIQSNRASMNVGTNSATNNPLDDTRGLFIIPGARNHLISGQGNGDIGAGA